MAGALKVWDGTQWQTTSATGANQSVYVGPDPPPQPPRSGDLWYDTDEPSPLANVVAVANGGTGATNAAAARTNLGVPATPVAIADGGTGATTAAAARSALAVPAVGQSGSTAGAPTSGTWVRGDQWFDSNNVEWICTTAGTPGTWTQVSLGTWSTYTPSWLGASSNPAIGNGSIAARYTIVGKTCSFTILISFGSTTTGGGGNLRLSLPAPAKLGFGNPVIGMASTYLPLQAISFSGSMFLWDSNSVLPQFPNWTNACQTGGWTNSSSGATGQGNPLVSGGYPIQSGGNCLIAATYEVA